MASARPLDGAEASVGLEVIGLVDGVGDDDTYSSVEFGGGRIEVFHHLVDDEGSDDDDDSDEKSDEHLSYL